MPNLTSSHLYHKSFQAFCSDLCHLSLGLDRVVLFHLLFRLAWLGNPMPHKGSTSALERGHWISHQPFFNLSRNTKNTIPPSYQKLTNGKITTSIFSCIASAFTLLHLLISLVITNENILSVHHTNDLQKRWTFTFFLYPVLKKT